MFAPPTFVKTSSGWSAESQRFTRYARWRSSRTCSPGVPPGRLQDNPRCCGVSSVAALTGEGRGNAYRLPSRPPPFHLRVCDVSVAWPVRCHGGCGLRLPRGHLRDRHRGCGVSVAWPVLCHRGCDRRLRRRCPRDRRRACDASFTSHIGPSPRIARRPPSRSSPRSSPRSPSRSSPDHHRACSSGGSRNINATYSALSAPHLREYRESRNRTSKTDGKIKRSHLDFVGSGIANTFSVASHWVKSRGVCRVFLPDGASRRFPRAPR